VKIGVCTLVLCSLATVLSCIDPSVRIVTNSPKVEPLLIFSGLKECEERGVKEKAQLPPLMQAYSAESPLDYISSTIARIKLSELEETLLVLPLDVVKASHLYPFPN
jgi:hypothetical protein